MADFLTFHAIFDLSGVQISAFNHRPLSRVSNRCLANPAA